MFDWESAIGENRIAQNLYWTRQLNLWVGCDKCSPGCLNCWAPREVPRFHADMRGIVKRGPDNLLTWTGEIQFNNHAWHILSERAKQWQAKRKLKPVVWFVCVRSDFFHDAINTEDIDRALGMIGACTGDMFLILTKRPQNIAEKMFASTERNPCRELGGGDYLPNVLLGVTIENQEKADERVVALRTSGWMGRVWLSIEPMLEEIQLRYRHWTLTSCHNNRNFDFVVVGGESGSHARPMNPDWARRIRDDCKAASVPFFMKQMSGKQPIPDDLNIREWPEVNNA
ncbi:MAG: phage Gp37/Gp68 family protein [Gammaproteobacteria bacterium]|nr:phage Gp37/Gp68 family protein [Gammaproteobacteria bacterium]